MSENQPHKVHLVSLGCPKNTVDSERMQGLLQGHAYQMTDAPEEADVVVVNTCGFIEPAKEESLAAIMDAHRLKQEGQCEGVIVTGCLSTRYYEELAEELVEADKLLTIADEADIVHHVDDVLGVQRPGYLARLAADFADAQALGVPAHIGRLRSSMRLLRHSRHPRAARE